jgi:hypothetical protein
LRYVTSENGERVAVLLDLEVYLQLARQLPSDPDLLVGLSEAELRALSESMLAPSAQARLDELLTHNAEIQLSLEESAELDQLLEQVDQLTILKARARYTLEHRNEDSSWLSSN